MAGSVVSYCDRRSEQCVFFYGACSPVWKVWCHSDFGNPGATVGHGDVFALYRLSSSYGCLIFNKRYPVDAEVSLPEQEEIMKTVGQIRELSADVPKKGSEHEHLSQMVAWYSRKLTCGLVEIEDEPGKKFRIAHSDTIIYTYLSLCRNCKNCNYDCQKVNITKLVVQDRKQIRGPCGAIDLTKIAKESLFYE